MKRSLPASGRMLVSACLAGRTCAYDGAHRSRSRDHEARASGPGGARVSGRGRRPRHTSSGGGARRGRRATTFWTGRAASLTDDGRDVTDEYLRGRASRSSAATDIGCHAAILKARSPACGCGAIYDGTFSRDPLAVTALQPPR